MPPLPPVQHGLRTGRRHDSRMVPGKQPAPSRGLPRPGIRMCSRSRCSCFTCSIIRHQPWCATPPRPDGRASSGGHPPHETGVGQLTHEGFFESWTRTFRYRHLAGLRKPVLARFRNDVARWLPLSPSDPSPKRRQGRGRRRSAAPSVCRAANARTIGWTNAPRAVA